MNAQLLQYARIELVSALTDLSGETKGQLEAFSEHAQADKHRYPRQHLAKVKLAGGRAVPSERAPTYVHETRSRQPAMPPIRESEFASCAWRRAVNALPIRYNSWIRYCYGFDLKFEHQKNICGAIWDAYQQYLPVGLLAKTQKRLISLVWLAVQDVAAKNSNDSYKEYAGAALASLMSVSRQGWSKTYAAHWARLKQVCMEFDNDALRMVLKRYENDNFKEDGDKFL